MGERALGSSVTSISHLVPYIQKPLQFAVEEIYYTTNVSLKAKDSMGWPGQGQVCQCFYFGHMDDLFKPSNSRDFNNIHNVPASGRAASQPAAHVYAGGVCYTCDHT